MADLTPRRQSQLPGWQNQRLDHMSRHHAMDQSVSPINPSSLLFFKPLSCTGHQQLPIASLDPAADSAIPCFIHLQCESEYTLYNYSIYCAYSKKKVTVL